MWYGRLGKGTTEMPTETITSFDDLIAVLDRNPQYRSRLRQSILDDEFQRLPEQMAALTERTQTLVETTASLAEHMDKLTVRMNQLTARTDQLTERMDQLTKRMDQLAERMDQLTERMDQLTKRMDQLTERMDQLTERMDQLTKRMDQLAARMDQLAERMDQLAERMDQLAERMDQLAERMDQLAERMDQLAERMDQLTERMDQLTAQMEELAARMKSQEVRTDWLMGAEAERRFRERAAAYFGHLLRRLRVVDSSALADQIDDAIDAGTFAEADREPLMRLDVVARGRDRATGQTRYLAVEASAGLGEGDVLRAADRAALLSRLTGVPAVPVVAGYSIAPGFRSIADQRNVQVVLTEEPR